MINRRRRRRYFNPRLLILIVGVIAIISLIVILFIPKTDNIRFEKFDDGINGTGLLVRNEEFVSLSDYEKVYYENLINGTFVEENTLVATAFKKGYIKTTLEKLVETEKNIVAYQNQSVINNFDDAEIDRLDFEIDVVISEMTTSTIGNIELYDKLCSLIKERQEHIKRNYNTDSNTYLQGLYADEKSMSESLLAWSDKLNAGFSGFVGFYCDRLESELNSQNIDSLGAKAINDFLKKENEEVKGFKIVKDEKWYVVLPVNDSTPFAVGNCYSVFIGNEAESELGCVEKIIDERDGKALVISIGENVEKYMDMRSATVFLGTRVQGFCVKSEYVSNGTVKVKGEQGDAVISIEVLAEKDGYIVFKETEQLEIGQTVYK